MYSKDERVDIRSTVPRYASAAIESVHWYSRLAWIMVSRYKSDMISVVFCMVLIVMLHDNNGRSSYVSWKQSTLGDVGPLAVALMRKREQPQE